MTNTQFALKVPVGSDYARAVGRNGAVDLGAIRLDLIWPTVSLGFVTAKRQILLHGGATFDGATMDRIAVEWLKARGWATDERRMRIW